MHGRTIRADDHAILVLGEFKRNAFFGVARSRTNREGTARASDRGLNVQEAINGHVCFSSLYELTTILTETVWTAPASLAAIEIGTEIRDALDAAVCVATDGAKM